MNYTYIHLIGGWLGFFAGICIAAWKGSDLLELILEGQAAPALRMARSGITSLFGLSVINFAYVITVNLVPLDPLVLVTSSLCVAGGSLTLPICCLLTAESRLCQAWAFVPLTAILLGTLVLAHGVLLLP